MQRKESQKNNKKSKARLEKMGKKKLEIKIEAQTLMQRQS